eukprot:NODE_37_length_35953_cov_1.028037.p5 type:complete len:243 gc:universal NODE_37_length_35953_cov_1.028037:16445-17173(+)
MALEPSLYLKEQINKISSLKDAEDQSESDHLDDLLESEFGAFALEIRQIPLKEDSRELKGDPFSSRFLKRFCSGIQRELARLDKNKKSANIFTVNDLVQIEESWNLSTVCNGELLYLKTFILTGFWLWLRFNDLQKLQWESIKRNLLDVELDTTFKYHKIFLHARKHDDSTTIRNLYKRVHKSELPFCVFNCLNLLKEYVSKNREIKDTDLVFPNYKIEKNCLLISDFTQHLESRFFCGTLI